MEGELGMERAAACKRPRAAPGGGWPTCRVARAAAGGKDRHSKVVTARGLRDRRVRLSVPTAIQFYDIQDRLGVDQPSKAIEWLIGAAAAAIDGLPSLDCSFALPAASPPPAAAGDDAEVSTSDTSKSSVLSLANASADNAAAAAAGGAHQPNSYNVNAGGAGAFAELLHCSAADEDKPMQQQQQQQQQQPTLAYYAAAHPSSHAAPPMAFEAMPQLAFFQDPTVTFDRGTLQSNAVGAPLWPPTQHPFLLQRFAAAPTDAAGLPFFLGGGGASAAVPANGERRLQLWDFKQERQT
ncbi:hypothetical protein ACP4OV_022975 [Aristida adscensionis]